MRISVVMLSSALIACASSNETTDGSQSAITSDAGVSTLRFSEQFVLEKVLEKKHQTFDAQKAVPEIRYASQVTLTEFQDAVFPQWGLRPDVITNVYVVALNRIYLIDDTSYYTTHNRFIDDSLAHELTHYVQSKYQGWVLDGADDSIESDAIDVQTWFRETYCRR